MKDRIYIINTEDLFLLYGEEMTNIENWQFEITYKNSNLIQIFDHEAAYVDIQDIEQVHIGGEEKITLFDRIEFLISFAIRNLANLIVLMMNNIMGAIDGNKNMTVSIDSIVFDNYPLTQLSLFTKNLDAGEKQNDFILMFVDLINNWYGKFMLIAIVVYLAILLYMGIRIVLNSTAAKQAMYKEVFMQWVTGLIILFTFPTVIRYAIKINTGFVDMIEKAVIESNDGNVSTDTSVVIGEHVAPDENSQITNENEVSEESHNAELNPFDNADKGYMAVMARRAHNTKRIAYAFVYLIMSFQLMLMAAMYYKRLFMVAFLLVLFPLVMVAHVLEKVANVKTGGAFGKWTKEILINIFIQSIHAIIYSFAVSTSLQAGENSSDWILMIVGVTFLFNGEEILKKILGQGSEMTPSFAKSAAKTVATVGVAKAAVGKVADNVIGAGSHLGKAVTAFRESRLNNEKAKNMDLFAQTEKKYKMPPASDLEHFKPEYTEFGDQEAIDLGNAIQVMNNIEYASADQITNAMGVIDNAKASGKYSELLKDLKMPPSQYQALQNARDRAADDAVKGTKTKQQIDMELTMELQQIFPAANPQILKRALYQQMGNPLIGAAATNRRTSDEGISKEIYDAKRRYEDLKNRINIADDKKKLDADPELANEAAKLLFETYGSKGSYTKEQYKMAINASILRNASSGKYDAKELMDAANYVHQNQGQDKDFAKMAKKVGCDVEDFRHVLAEKIARKAYAENYRTSGSPKRFTGKSGSRLDLARQDADKVLAEYEGPNQNFDDDDEVSVSQIMQHEFDLEACKNNAERDTVKQDFEEKIKTARQKWNTDSQAILTDFSKEMLEANKDVPKIDGMTKEELQQKAKAQTSEGFKQALKAVSTTGASILAAPIGAGLMVGMSEDKGIIAEAATGALGAAALADGVVEGLQKEETKTIYVRDPYSGEMVPVEVQVSGMYADHGAILSDSELAAAASSKIDSQLRERARIRRENEIQNAEMNRKYDEARKRFEKISRQTNDD